MTKRLNEINERLKVLDGEVSGLIKLDSRTAEQDQRIDAILKEINEDLGPARVRELQLADYERDARARAQEPAGPIAAREHAREGAEDAEKIDRRSAMQRFVESEQYKRARETGSVKTEPVKVPSLHRRGGSAIQFNDARVDPQELRSLITSGSLSASMVQPDVLPTIYRARERDLRMRDVLINAQTSSDSIIFLQENSFTNNAAEVAEATTTSNGTKPESALDFTEATAPVRTIAHWVPITRQQLADAAWLRTYVEDRLRVGIMRREDGQILNGNGTPPNLTGILNTSGIQNLDETYFTGAPVINAGQPVENFNRIRRAKRMVRITGGATPTFLVVNPEDLEELETIGDANRQYYGPGPFTNGDFQRIWGLPVVESENIAAGTALVGDGLMAAVVDREDTQIYSTDSHSDFFVKNIIVILAEERIALPVFRPIAFAKVALA